MMKEVDYGVKLTHDMQAQISTAAVAGALCGQLIFGVLGDWFGRRSVRRPQYKVWMGARVVWLTICGVCIRVMARSS